MNLKNPMVQPNFSGYATMPVWPLDIAILLLARHATDSAGWRNGDQFKEGLLEHQNKTDL